MTERDFDGGVAAEVPDPFVPQLYENNSVRALRHSLSWWLIGVGRLWRNLLDEHLRAAGQTQPRWRVLAWATMLPGIRQADLAERMDLARPTLVRLLDSLEKQGIIERRESPTDRRANGVYLTAKAAPLVRDIEREVQELGDFLLQDVSAEEIEQCLDVLRRIRGRVNQVNRTTKGFPLPPSD